MKSFAQVAVSNIWIFRSSSSIKYLDVYLDQSLTFQEVKRIIQKMACGIKTLYSSETIFLKKFVYLYLPHNQSSPLLGNFIGWLN